MRSIRARASAVLVAAMLLAGGAHSAESQWLEGWRESSRTVGASSPSRFSVFLATAAPRHEEPGTAIACDRPSAGEAESAGVIGGDDGPTAIWLTSRLPTEGFAADPLGFLREHGMLLTIALVLLAGLLLNFTPCVLPMIPVNLALIGAGTENASRKRGACLGGAYAAGIAAAHGIPGAIIVAAGGGFIGVIQSSPWFSLVAAILFAALALALLDVFFIDLSRLRNEGGATTGIAAAAIAGAISVLMAGACIEPVTLAVLLLAGDLYASGSHAAAILPFALGIGMALPWPFLGAGLARVPRPGRWMVWIKRGFAIFVFLLAARYARLAWLGFTAGKNGAPQSASGGIEIAAGDIGAWRNALQAARAASKPALVDFGASWCRACDTMDEMFRDDEMVKSCLEQFVLIRVRAEKPREPAAREMLDAFGVVGLPTFIVLEDLD